MQRDMPEMGIFTLLPERSLSSDI